MASLITVLFFVAGLVVGSFLNVVILRGEKGEGFGGRSRCRHCKKVLGIAELIPVMSFILQRGRCRGCHRPFSAQYPLVEIGAALAFAAIAWFFLYSSPSLSGGRAAVSAQDLLGLGVALLAASASIVVLVSDLRFQIIPDGAVVILAGAGVITSLTRDSLLADLVVAAGAALFFFALWIVSRGRWMGLGDAKLIFATSLFVGFPAAIAAVLFAFWLGGATGAVLLLAGGKQWGSRIPFGPFILAGALAAWFSADAFFTYTGLSLLF